MNDFLGTGRRKTSIARVRLIAGTGKRTVNGRDLDQYFSRLALSRIAIQPLVSSNNLDKYDIVANVRGGARPARRAPSRWGWPARSCTWTPRCGACSARKAS